MRVRDLTCAVLALALLSPIAGCVRPVVVNANVLYPARVPVRAFPAVWVVGGELPEGDLGGRLAKHLQQDGREVKRVALKDLEPLHAAGAISPLTLVVLLEAGLASEVQEGYDTVPVQYCDFYWGCYTQYQGVFVSQPVLAGEVKLTVYEGPTARVLQAESFYAAVAARDEARTRKQVVDDLGVQLERAVDLLKTEVRVELEPVDSLPLVTQALARIRAGDWAAGRELLEQQATQLGGRDRSEQARVWYDLGVARWRAAGPDGLTQPVFEAAKRALGWAVARGGDRYRPALEGLIRARERQAVLEAQRSAMTYNFGLRAGTATASTQPPAPSGATPASPSAISPVPPNAASPAPSQAPSRASPPAPKSAPAPEPPSASPPAPPSAPPSGPKSAAPPTPPSATEGSAGSR